MLKSFFLFSFIFSFLLSKLDTNIFWIDLFSQFSLQILIGGILLTIIYFTLRKFWTFFISGLICILLSYQIFLPCNNCNSFLKVKSENYNKIRLMTFNVHHINQLDEINDLIKLILEENPDIILFQEVSNKMQNKLASIKSFYPYNVGLKKKFQPNFNLKYSVIQNFFDSIMKMNKNKMSDINSNISELRLGSIIFSKYPLINSRLIYNDKIIITNTLLDEKELIIIGAHLYPPTTQHHFNLAKKQIEYLSNLVLNNDKKIILMGDLNMVPISKRFTNFLKKSKLYTYASYKDPKSTWPSYLPYYLGIQIDHVLFSKEFKMINKKTINNFGSDHRPLLVDLVYKSF